MWSPCPYSTSWCMLSKLEQGRSRPNQLGLASWGTMAAFFCRKANAKRQWTDSFGRVTASGTGGWKNQVHFRNYCMWLYAYYVVFMMVRYFRMYIIEILMKLQPAATWWILSHQPWFAEVAMLFEFCPGGHLLNLLDKAEAPARHSKMRQVTGIQKRIPYLESVMSLIRVPKYPPFFVNLKLKHGLNLLDILEYPWIWPRED